MRSLQFSMSDMHKLNSLLELLDWLLLFYKLIMHKFLSFPILFEYYISKLLKMWLKMHKVRKFSNQLLILLNK